MLPKTECCHSRPPALPLPLPAAGCSPSVPHHSCRRPGARSPCGGPRRNGAVGRATRAPRVAAGLRGLGLAGAPCRRAGAPWGAPCWRLGRSRPPPASGEPPPASVVQYGSVQEPVSEAGVRSQGAAQERGSSYEQRASRERISPCQRITSRGPRGGEPQGRGGGRAPGRSRRPARAATTQADGGSGRWQTQRLGSTPGSKREAEWRAFRLIPLSGAKGGDRVAGALTWCGGAAGWAKPAQKAPRSQALPERSSPATSEVKI